MKKRSIKKILLLLLILGVYSCQDNEIAEVKQKTITEKQNESDFLVFSTRGETPKFYFISKKNRRFSS